MTLVNKAVAFAQSEEQRQQHSSSSPSAASLPPVIPLLCLFSASRTEHDGVGSDEYEVQIEVKHIALLESSVTSKSTSTLFSSLVTKCTTSIHEFHLLHTEADFYWDDEDADEEEEEHTGNEGSSIEKTYHRAGILLMTREARWNFIAGNIDARTLITELQEAASITSTVDVEECVQLALVLHRHLTSNTVLYPSFLAALDSLLDRATEQDMMESAEQIRSLWERVWAESVIDFSGVTAATQLDQLASTRGMDKLRAPLVSAFRRSLTVSPPTLSVLAAAHFLLRLFLLRPSTIAQPATVSTAPPVYDGSMQSIRAICNYVLLSPSPLASFTFPASLEKDERHLVHTVAEEVGGSRLHHESTGYGSRRALTITRTRVQSAVGRDRQPTAGDPLSALLSGLPQSADAARLPAQWVKTVSEMCEVLCGEVDADRLLEKSSLGHDVPTVADVVIAVLLLFALYRQQRANDVAHSGGVHRSVHQCGNRTLPVCVPVHRDEVEQNTGCQ